MKAIKRHKKKASTRMKARNKIIHTFNSTSHSLVIGFREIIINTFFFAYFLFMAKSFFGPERDDEKNS